MQSREVNSAGLTILAETITKEFLGTIIVEIIFVIITKRVPPEHFLCNDAATGCPCVQENMRRNLLCKEIVLQFLQN